MLGFLAGYLIGWGADSALQKMQPGALRVFAYLLTWLVLFVLLIIVMAVLLETNGMSSRGPGLSSMATGMTVALIVLRITRKRSNTFDADAADLQDANVKTGIDKALEEGPVDEEWELLRRSDPQVREAIAMLKPYGHEAIDELRESFRLTGDKSRIRHLASELIAQYESGTEDRRQGGGAGAV